MKCREPITIFRAVVDVADSNNQLEDTEESSEKKLKMSLQNKYYRKVVNREINRARKNPPKLNLTAKKYSNIY